MPAQVYEDFLETEFSILEAVPLRPGDPEEFRRSYPYPRLKLTDRKQPMRFGTVVLENDYLKATIVPSLGGRITSLYDKRTQTEILPQDFGIAEGEPRGAELNQGIALDIGLGERLTKLGPVDFQIEDSDEDGPARVWLAELQSGTGLSWHARILLPPDRAELQIMLRLLNRTRNRQDVSRSVAVPPAFRAKQGIYFSEQTKTGFAVESAGFGLSPMGPRQLDTIEVRLTPITGMDNVSASGDGLSANLSDTTLEVQAARPFLGVSVLLNAPNGTLEAKADLYPEKVERFDLPPGVDAVVIRDKEGGELLRYVSGQPQAEEPTRTAQEEFALAEEGDASALVSALADIGTRSAAYNMTGTLRMRQGSYSEAAELFETSLLYNAEDHLTWWAKAVAHRLEGGEEERPELLNAHYLAPLEPLLRAESTLGQQNLSGEPNPLLKPLADNPEALDEVGFQLLDLGLYAELSKWVEEALKHREIPMLRYLLAFALLKGSRMQVEAAQQVAQASKAPINPPYPWRPAEMKVLRYLAEAFPSDARISEMVKLSEWGLGVL